LPPLTSRPAIFENLLGVNPELAEQIVEKTEFLKWLLQRIQAKTHDENRGYASELLSILLQSSRRNRLVLAKEGGVEVLLQSLAVSQFHETFTFI
jgi:beta-catenin-like protein 1